PLKAEKIASAQDIPMKFLENILWELKRAELVFAQRGASGGYWLARPAAEISLADIFRAVEGPLVKVQGQRPATVAYRGAAALLREVWVATRASVRTGLEAA